MIKIHHLNCGTMCPVGFLFKGKKRNLCCHCLLIESANGLVLVDTGFGLRDIADTKKRLGRFHFIARPKLEKAETAIEQIKALGFKSSDVRHIILTHLDPDHAGGISDFPDALVHCLGSEYIAALAPVTLIEKLRYRRIQWAHGPKWQLHKLQGDRWFDFEAVKNLPGLPPEILLVPLIGHTLGHCGIAVQTESGWILHAGDAYFFYGQLHKDRPRCPSSLKLFQRVVQVDGESRLFNLERLRILANDPETKTKVFCAHDPVELSKLRFKA